MIFADVKLQGGDNEAKLRKLGLRFTKATSPNSKPKFTQPCAAFDGCRCRIYEDRPNYCRAFECWLLKQVKAGTLSPRAALRVIRDAKSRVREVERLLEKLGDPEDATNLRARFQRTIRKLEQTKQTSEASQFSSELTLAMHELNRLLSESFYSG